MYGNFFDTVKTKDLEHAALKYYPTSVCYIELCSHFFYCNLILSISLPLYCYDKVY